MFFRLFAFLAVVAVAFASPKPDPQVYTTYSAPGVVPVGYTGYPAVGYSLPYTAGAALPYAYNGYYIR